MTVSTARSRIRMTKPQLAAVSPAEDVVSAKIGEPSDFASALRDAMSARNMTSAEVARAVQSEIPAFSPGNISHYLAGRSLPRNHVLGILSKILETDFQAYSIQERRPRATGPLAVVESGPAASKGAALSVTDAGNGEAHVYVNQKVSWALALKILQLVNEDAAK